MKPRHQFHVLFAIIFTMSLRISLGWGATVRVIDANTRSGIKTDIYLVDRDGQPHRVGQTNSNGIFVPPAAGKQGEKYAAISEQYDRGDTECPVANAIIAVHRTTLLEQHQLKGESLASAGKPGPAALEFRKAAVIAEKRDPVLFKQLEGKVAASAATALHVEQPFAKKENRTTTSKDLHEKVREYQQGRDLRATGALDRETLTALAGSGKY